MKPKSQKRDEAVDRQRDREDRSARDQLYLLKSRPGNSARETARLLENISIDFEP